MSAFWTDQDGSEFIQAFFILFKNNLMFIGKCEKRREKEEYVSKGRDQRFVDMNFGAEIYVY